MDSLIVLAMPWSSLPIIWKLSWLVVWPVVLLWLCMGEGSLRCSLNLFSKGPGCLSNVFLITHKFPTLKPIDGPTFVFHGVLILWGIPGCSWWSCCPWSGSVCHTYCRIWCFCIGPGCMVWQCGLWPCLQWWVGLVPAVSCLFSLFPPSLLWLVNLLSILSMAHIGVLAVTKCLPEVIHFLLEKLWLVAHCSGPVGKGIDNTIFRLINGGDCPHCRYWSVLVGFLYTMIDRLLSGSGLTIVSKKHNGTIFFVVFHCKLNGQVNTIHVF